MKTETNTHRCTAPIILYSFATGVLMPRAESHKRRRFRFSDFRAVNFGLDRFMSEPGRKRFCRKRPNPTPAGTASPHGISRETRPVDHISVTSVGNFVFDISQIIVF
ncbi:hypothetical protein [Burkholderia stagnalis]